MPPIPIEICLHATARDAVQREAGAAYLAGATTIELCAAMEVGGLTPLPNLIEAARQAFNDRSGLMVMIRPHADSFVYTAEGRAIMLDQIRSAQRAGADGVVFGPLQPNHQLDREHTQTLVEAAQTCNLKSTFHRAFDLIPDPLPGLDFLIELGVDRVLTAGLPWGQPGTALDGIEQIAALANHAQTKIQVIAGGGVTPQNARQILDRLPTATADIALHAFSGAQIEGQASIASVRALIDAANPIS